MGAPLLPAHALYFNVSGQVLFTFIPLAALCLFAWTVFRRSLVLRSGLQDPRLDETRKRLGPFLRYWLFQWKHPRYRFAGGLHIVIFLGFLVLSLRSVSLVLIGIFPGIDLQKSLGPYEIAYA